MRYGIRDIFNFKMDRIINLALWSAVFTVYLLFDKYNGGIDFILIMMFIYLLISIMLLNFLLFIILRPLLSFFRYGDIISYLASNLVITFIFVVNNMTVLVYGKQLGSEGLVMAFRGWSGGELGDFTLTLIKTLLVIGFYVFLFFLSYVCFNYILSGTRLGFCSSLGSVLIITLVIVSIHFRLMAAAVNDREACGMKDKIPWQALTGFSQDLAGVLSSGEKGKSFLSLFADPVFLDEKTELEQLKRLNLVSQKILSSGIDVRTPYNILFINIEGLRHDMLNRENMPFLYKFASDKGFILKKHYTTGNNTPGALYGMLTGLAPYYFEPLRGNGFLNMSLQVLKKAGYMQSFYYNSPMEYEYIHRDIIEKTQSKYCCIPGTKEEYAPREKKLIDMLLGDMKSDQGVRRFDYYLMNVSHFNYYYPDDCRKYLPDYTSNFTIISGTQESFKKDGVQLKNRYMNAVLYTDRLLARLITEMERIGRLENTIIVISGDHGEEFWEHGSFGHTWGLNNIQIQPAALIYYPGIKKRSIRYRYSSHQDFMPTVFDIIGLNTDWRLFTTGKSLVAYDPDLDYAISSLGILVSFKRNGYAIAGNGYKILYRNNMDLNKSPYAIFDDNDNPVEEFDTGMVKNLLLKTSSAKRLAVPGM